MKLLSHILNTSNDIIDIFEDIRRNSGFILLRSDDNIPGFSISTHECQKSETKTFLKHIADMGTATCIETYARLMCVLDGPKIFRPACDNLMALESMALNVALDDYVQPFDTVIIDFPEEYTKQYEMENILPGYRYGSNITATKSHTIDFVVVHRATKVNAIFICVYFTSSDCYSTMLWGSGEGETIEEALTIARNKKKYAKSLDITDTESDTVFKAIRSALNSILVIEELGIKKVGPLDPEKTKQLISGTQSHIRVNRRKAARALERDAIVYSFDQDIKLYDLDSESESRELGSKDGGNKKPHFRRGYWRTQHHGVKNSLTKRVRIPSVLVNGHLFKGRNSDTSTMYS